MGANETSELIFITIMMVLILILCGVAMYIFAKTYRKEMRARQEEKERKAAAIRQAAEAAAVSEGRESPEKVQTETKA